MASAPAALSTPNSLLYRIGRAPDPLDLPPHRFVGSGRFDDPMSPPAYRVLYAGGRLACFHECLAPFCVDLNGVAAQGITREWFGTRHIASFKLYDPDQTGRWLDLTAPATLFSIRSSLSGPLQQLGYTDFDMSVALGSDRALTRQVGKWAFSEGYRGIKDGPRHALGLSCWAIFEVALIEIHDPGSAISLDDEDLRLVSRDWNLPLP